MKRILVFSVFLILITFGIVFTQNMNSKKQFVYILRPVRLESLTKGMTEEETKIRQEHFAHLQKKYEEGVITYVGRVDKWDESTFAMIVFNADSETEAQQFMENDPGVRKNLQRANLYPFKTVFGKFVEKDFAKTQNMADQKQWAYILRPGRVEMITKGQTEAEKLIQAEHFQYLQEMHQQGKITFVGRTMNMDENIFGIAIYYADSETEARQIMERDPGVKKGLQKGTLHPFKTVFGEVVGVKND